MSKWTASIGWILLVLTACERREPPPLPTRIPDISQVATADQLTANAPPEGFREAVAFPQIDANLTALSNWRYDLTLQFNGVYSNTPRPASGSVRVQVWYNLLGQQRRVLLEAVGEVFGLEESQTILREGVRLGPDAFLVENNTCRAGQDGEPALAADLQAGALIGGVNNAVPAGVRAVINGEAVWRYDFAQDALTMPFLRLPETGRILNLSSELWIAPEHNAVIRYWVTMSVENAILFESLFENALPVSGEVILRYDVYDIGLDPNITQPFGC